MVIGFDGSRAFVNDKTGTENYSFQLLKNLAKIDTENYYIVYIRPSLSMYTPGVLKEKWADNFQFKVINWPRLWTQAGLALQTFKDKLDILFVPSHTLPIISKPGIKKVVTVHDLGAEYLPQLHQVKQRLYLNFMTHKQLKSATKIIAVSKATKDDLLKKVGINPKKVEVIYEGVDQEFFKPVKNDVLVNSLKKFDLEKQNYFLFVGTIQPRKNLKRLIKAYSVLRLKIIHPSFGGKDLRLKNTNSRISDRQSLIINHQSIPELVLVGQKGWMSDDIYQLPKKLGIEDRVKFLGRVDNKDLPALYSGAIGLTFPSLFEGFGLPIIEAFSTNCPVLTSNRSSMKEIAQNNAILVDPEDINDIVKGMEQLMDEKTREDLITKGFKKAKEFSWETCAKKTLEVFKEVAMAE